MNLFFKSFLSVFLGISLVSCNSDKEKLKIEQQVKEAILGDWDFVEEITKSDLLGGQVFSIPNPKPGEFNSISISKDSIEFYLGIYDFSVFSEKEKSKKSFYGTFTHYKMNYDTLVIHNLVRPNHPYKWKFERCKNDTLEFRLRDSTLVRYKRIYPNNETLPTFDKVVVSTTGCYGTCEVLNLLINTKGELLFQGQDFVNPLGFYSGKLNSAITQNIFRKFEKANPLTLKDYYAESISDQSSTFVSLIKDDKIVKTIEDYSFRSPKEFIWAYLPLTSMYQLTSLNSLKKDVIPQLTYFEFKKGNKILNIKKSESFYLFSELENAVQTNVDFKPKYELLFQQSEIDINKISNIKTDGRYFKYNFKNSKVVIVDLGYNFIERNFKSSDFIDDIR